MLVESDYDSDVLVETNIQQTTSESLQSPRSDNNSRSVMLGNSTFINNSHEKIFLIIENKNLKIHKVVNFVFSFLDNQEHQGLIKCLKRASSVLHPVLQNMDHSIRIHGHQIVQLPI